MPRKGYVWVPAAPTFTKDEKDKILEELKEFIDDSGTLKNKVQSFAMRKNFLYLYEHLTPEKPEHEGEYIRWNYARITFKDKLGSCTADWQRSNDQWIEFHKGTLNECLKYIDDGNGFFAG
jgi:hypothetical protein